MPKPAVGLFLLTHHPATGELITLLHVRGELNMEKGDWKESWVGGCQPTVHGKLEEGENHLDALRRETLEELGDDMRRLVWHAHEDGRLACVSDGDAIKTYALLLSHDCVTMNRLHAGSGGFRIVRQSDLPSIRNLKDFPRDQPVPRDVTAMFDDDIGGLESAFEVFA